MAIRDRLILSDLNLIRFSSHPPSFTISDRFRHSQSSSMPIPPLRFLPRPRITPQFPDFKAY